MCISLRSHEKYTLFFGSKSSSGTTQDNDKEHSFSKDLQEVIFSCVSGNALQLTLHAPSILVLDQLSGKVKMIHCKILMKNCCWISSVLLSHCIKMLPLNFTSTKLQTQIIQSITQSNSNKLQDEPSNGARSNGINLSSHPSIR